MTTLFDRLKTDESPAWSAYTEHAFLRQMADGTLPKSAFQTYLEQDYLFLIQFARAYALAGYKSRTLADLQDAADGLSAIMSEMGLHVRLCERWGVSADALEALPELPPCVAYTRYVLDAGLSGDLFDLHITLSPCVIGYGEIGRALIGFVKEMPNHPYREWIEEYAGVEYQSVASAAIQRLDRLSEGKMTEARYSETRRLFRLACQLEADFWQMGLTAQRS